MRYEVTELEGYPIGSMGGLGISCMVVDTMDNHRVMATYRSEDYARNGREWAREGATIECMERNAAQPREALPASRERAS